MVQHISAVATRDWLASSSQHPTQAPVLLDIREPWELALASLPNAQHIPMGQVVTRVNEIDETRPIIVFCHHGVRSLQVVAFLLHQGMTDVHNLTGGIEAWSKTVDASINLY